MTERQGQRVGGAVDDDVDAAKGGDSLIDQSRDRIEIAHVRGNADRLDSHLGEVCNHGVAGVGLSACHGDLGPGNAESLGDCLADAAGAARDDGDPTGQVVEVVEFRDPWCGPCGCLRQLVVEPPLTAMVWPVIHAASSEARKVTA